VDQRERTEDRLESLKVALDGRQAQMWTSLPAKVLEYNSTDMTVRCKATIPVRIQNQDGSYTWKDIPDLPDVPVCFPRAGGFVITFPILPGDPVLVVFSSRCIDGWWASNPDVSGPQSKPYEMRMHDLSDGFAIPGPFSRPEAQGINPSTTNLEIRDEGGTTFLQITPDGHINLIAPTGISLLAPSVSLGENTTDPNNSMVRVGDLQEYTDNLKGLIQAAINNLSARVQGGSGVPAPVIGNQVVSGATKVKGV
jgi:Phage protein Gp138 N-terminal domain